MAPLICRPRKRITGADVHAHPDGYSVVLHSGAFAWAVRDGRRVRRWRSLERALAHLVSHYGVLSVRLQFHAERCSQND